MNFSEYLQSRQKSLDLKSAAEHYRSLGGRKKLGISIRHFQQISSGVTPPTERLLSAIFDQVEIKDQKIIVTAFFRSVFRNPKKGQQLLLDYIENHLTPAVEGSVSSLWEKTKSFTFLNEEQMEFLISQGPALRCYQKVILLEQIQRSNTNISDDLLNKLVSYNLILMNGNQIIPTNKIFRIPTIENSGHSHVRLGNELMSKILSLYLSRDGHPKQEIHFRIQLVTRTAAERILEQFKNFNKWIQSLAIETREDDSEAVPFIFYGVTKVMDLKEL